MRHSANKNLDANLLSKLDCLLREINEYAKTYKLLGELEKEENEKSTEHGIQPSNYSIRFISDASRDPRRYNVPTSSEVAVVFSDENERTTVQT